jgi:hypothetical protein
MSSVFARRFSFVALCVAARLWKTAAMDDYPEHLRPIEQRPFDREPFSMWWSRAQPHFSSVPRNVGRQWIYQHWGNSGYGWLPSRGATFALQTWQPTDVYSLAVDQVTSNECWANWGDQLLANAKEAKEFVPLLSIMKRRMRWPAPPIVLDNRRPNSGRLGDLPKSYVLVEGHRRSAMAKALARRGLLSPDLPVWVLSYF